MPDPHVIAREILDHAAIDGLARDGVIGLAGDMP
jgi:hypothetical protein